MTNITVLEDTALRYRVEVGTVAYVESQENSYAREPVIQIIDEEVEWELVCARDTLEKAQLVRDQFLLGNARVRIVEVTK